MQVREGDTEAQRRRMLEAAARLLSEQGATGLTVRRVADLAGGSTQMVYTLFGGKPGLAAGLYVEGHDRLGAAMGSGLAMAPPPGDPERLVAIGQAYCQFALAEPAFFSSMFAGSVAGYLPDDDTRDRCRAKTLVRVVDTAAECLTAGTLEAADAETIAHSCWAVAHGLAGLLVAGLVPIAGTQVDEGLRAVVRGFRTEQPR